LFGFTEDLRLTPKQGRIAAEFHEHGDLGAKDFRHDWLEQKIHRSEIVSPKQMFLALVGGKEQDRGK